MPEEEAEEIFVGREGEINNFMAYLERDSGAYVFAGEKGIGKSALIDEIYKRLIEKDDIFVGKYMCLHSTRASDPYVEVLVDMLIQVKDSVAVDDFIKGGMKKAGQATWNVLKEKKRELVKTLLKEVLNVGKSKIGEKTGEEISKFVEEVYDDMENMPSALKLADVMVAQHEPLFVHNYIDLFRFFSDEFKDKKFVLLIDQFERVDKLANDIYCDFLQGLPKNIFIIVSSINEPAQASNIEKMKEFGAKIVELLRLNEDDIGTWIGKIRKKDFSRPTLVKIKKKSGGFPLLLKEWIETSSKLDINELDESKLNTFFEKRISLLGSDERIFLRKISVLLWPLSVTDYQEITGVDSDNCGIYLNRLVQNQIFKKLDALEKKWFRHELIQGYVVNSLEKENRKKYHKNAADFFEKKFNDAREKGEKVEFNVALGLAHHFHFAEEYQKSYEYNSKFADFCFNTGSLDIAEQCYLSAIEDAEDLGDDEGVAVNRGNLGRVYDIWGRLDDALNSYSQAAEFYRQLGDDGKQGFSRAIHNIAILHQDKGEYEEALEKYNQSLEICEELGDKSGIAKTLHQIAILHQDKGEYEDALEKYNQSLEICEKLGDQLGIAITIGQVGILSHEQKDYENAIRNLFIAASIFKHLQSPNLEIVLNKLSIIRQDIGEDKFNEIVNKLQKDE